MLKLDIDSVPPSSSPQPNSPFPNPIHGGPELFVIKPDSPISQIPSTIPQTQHPPALPTLRLPDTTECHRKHLTDPAKRDGTPLSRKQNKTWGEKENNPQIKRKNPTNLLMLMIITALMRLKLINPSIPLLTQLAVKALSRFARRFSLYPNPRIRQFNVMNCV